MKRFAAALLLSAATVSVQTDRGAISGPVSDQSGGVVAGATVTIVNQRTNQTRKVVTAQDGTYTAADLELVSYTLNVAAPGLASSGPAAPPRPLLCGFQVNQILLG